MTKNIFSIINECTNKMNTVIKNTQEYLKTIKIGIMAPYMFNNIYIECNDISQKIIHIATFENKAINILHITPWNKKHLVIIEKAILTSSLNISPKNDGEKLIIVAAMPNKNERLNIVKNIKKNVEYQKIKIRNFRRLYNKLIKKEVKKDKLSIDLEHETNNILNKNMNIVIQNINIILNKTIQNILNNLQ